MMTEAEFLSQVIEASHLLRWRVAHFRPARTDKGWRTAVSADGQGFPDLVLIRPPRVIFAELKSDRGSTTPDQRDWLVALEGCPNVESYVWKPYMWDDIVGVLR